jgi:hypothetical protein
MHGVRRWCYLLLIAVSTFGLTTGQSRRGAPLSGPAVGTWELPEFPAMSGSVLGSLEPVGGGASLYVLQATLIDLGAACPACMIGEIHGTLDDGIGPAPDYLVEGGFGATYPGGAGTFLARVKRPNGTPAGWLRGRFEDPPGSPQPGSFLGRFRITL